MILISRSYAQLEQFLVPGKVLVIYGPRQVGKTTLVKNFLQKTKLKYKLDSGENIKTREILSSQDFVRINEYAEGYELLVIDEAQAIENIGLGLKILVDQNPKLHIIATGSSSFDLANKLGEPLTGRKRTLTLYPIAQLELHQHYNKHELREQLNTYLVFGSYPDIVTAKTKSDKQMRLEELANAYLYKDILALDKIKNPKALVSLVKLLAFQIGQEVSYSELAAQVMLDTKTVQKYLDLLEKTFVLIPVQAYSKNLRKEITSKNKYYFWDVGIRNSIIAQFNDITSRNDLGQLWENFLMVERFKRRAYHNQPAHCYFWRTYDQQEIDLIEERDGSLFAYEFKWSEKKKKTPPKSWSEAYPQTHFEIVNADNYLDFIL